MFLELRCESIENAPCFLSAFSKLSKTRDVFRARAMQLTKHLFLVVLEKTAKNSFLFLELFGKRAKNTHRFQNKMTRSQKNASALLENVCLVRKPRFFYLLFSVFRAVLFLDPFLCRFYLFSRFLMFRISAWETTKTNLHAQTVQKVAQATIENYKRVLESG